MKIVNFEMIETPYEIILILMTFIFYIFIKVKHNMFVIMTKMIHFGVDRIMR